jgi:competence protein ComEA
MDRMQEARLERAGVEGAEFGIAEFRGAEFRGAGFGGARLGVAGSGVARTAQALRAAARVGLAALALGAMLVTTLPAVVVAQDAPGIVNVNTATLDELVQLPGIGEKRAQAILEARQQRGGFKSVDELLDIRGIGPANLEKLRPHLSVSGKSGAAQ